MTTIRLVVAEEEAFFRQTGRELTAQGMFVPTTHPLSLGQEVEVVLETADSVRLFSAKGRVIGLRAAQSSTREPAGILVKFHELAPGSHEWLESRVPADETSLEDLAPSPPPAPVHANEKAPLAWGSVAVPAAMPWASPAPSAAETTPSGSDTPPPPEVAPPPPIVEASPPPPAVTSPPSSAVATPPVPSVAAASAASTEVATPVPAAGRARHFRRASDKILGIDLGTTFSCAAVVIDGEAKVVPSSGGYRTFPSVVTVTGEGELVGWASYDRLATFPKQTIYGSKRLLGRNFQSQPVQDALRYFDYEIVQGDDGEAAVRLAGTVCSLVWVAARILEDVRAAACRFTGEEVTKAVITVPAYYGDRQRQAVAEAGRQAGLDVLQIVNEPTAAAIAYGVNRGFDQRILVYDLGGGTFDVSILEIHGNLFEVLATGGDAYLGGVDFDNRIVDYCLQELKKKSGEDLSSDTILKLRLRQVAENAKRELSSQNEARVFLPHVQGRSGPLSVDVTLSRDRLNRLVSDLVDRTLEICRKTLDEAKINPKDLDEVVFVGGQTRMPLVQGKVHTLTGKQPRKGVHPDEAVAIGAALLGFSRDKIDAPTLVDVLSQPIGVGLPGGRFKEIVPRQSQLPLSMEFTRATTQDDQTAIVLDVYQGDQARVDKNEFLGTVRLGALAPRPKGQVSVRIQFRLDAQGLLTISGTESVSGRSQVVSLATKDTPETLKEALAVARAESATAATASDADTEPEKKEKTGLLGRLFGR